ncbi:MAG: tRNA uridine-5-carboxymethylaminomethyl(34) synthesis GTPase MnmE [Clostridia bacterium]|nr:tRNA uridine-5-carboxymethylaminomethyl(34) synthesis GTPase MnmE [Clostridia bacterium]
MLNDTIAAISTAQAAGGIGIIRLSGEDAPKIADKIFKAKTTLTSLEGGRFIYGKIYSLSGELIDEAVALKFEAPHSYTGENVIELDCHGGLVVTKLVLRAALEAGARPAGPGEFTKRAFLNGRMGLTEAESVMDIISASGSFSQKAAQSAREGAVAKRLEGIKAELTLLAAKITVWTDYPEDDAPDIDEDIIRSTLLSSKQRLEALLNEYDSGKAARQGVLTAIAGRPNVGKSTLMNMLSGVEKSIVTEYAGTTRDIVEETVVLKNAVLHLLDTAGMRDTDDPVEAIGVKKAYDTLEKAELILAVFDSSEPLTENDKELCGLCKNKKAIAVINKNDLQRHIDTTFIKEHFEGVAEISAKNQDGREQLINTIEKVLGTFELDASIGILANERQRDCAAKALESIKKAIETLESKMTFDAVGVCIDDAISSVLSLTGEKVTETVVNEVFERFCVGK